MAADSFTPESLGATATARGRLPFSAGRRLHILLAAGTLLLLPSFQWPPLVSVMFMWDLLLLVLWLMDLLLLPKASSFDLQRAWSGPLQLSFPSHVQIAVTNTSRRYLTVFASDAAPADFVEQIRELTFELAPLATGAQQYPVVPRERGSFTMGPVYLRYRSLFALGERWAIVHLPQTVLVLPDVKAAQERALQVVRNQQAKEARRQRQQPGAGREFETLREYREGDELRNISWTATARRRQLVTRTFTAERSQTVWLMVDAGRLLRARVRQEDETHTLGKLDYSVNAALAVAEVASRFGDSVGFIGYGRCIEQVAAPGRGPAQMRRFTDSLARLRVERFEASHARAARMLLARQSRRALVVWITDFAETPTTPDVVEHAAYLSRRHLVVLGAIGHPDLAATASATPQNEAELFRHAAAREVLQRRDLLFRELRHLGVLALELMPEHATTALINEYLMVRDRSLI